MKRTILLITTLVLLSACSQGRGRLDEQTVEETNGDTDNQGLTPTTTPEPLAQSGTMILADGQLETVKPAATLGFSVSGRISEIRVNAGDTVDEGTVLALISDKVLAEAVASAELQVAQAESSLAQAKLNLEDLLTWEPDELAVEVAKANLAVAEANYEGALAQDSVAANSLTSSRVGVDQAERSVADAQEAYDTAWDPARDWELGDPWRKQALEYERDATSRALQNAEESLAIARANLTLALAGLDTNAALNADAAVAGAQQALFQAQNGPSDSDIAQAQLRVEQAALSLEEAEFALTKANDAMDDISLVAPWSGTVLSINSSDGAIVSAGTPVITLLDTKNLQFVTNNLSERDLASVSLGQPAEITLKTYPGEVLKGTVERIAPQAGGMIGDAATFSVIIKLDSVKLLLLPGMTGRVEI